VPSPPANLTTLLVELATSGAHYRGRPDRLEPTAHDLLIPHAIALDLDGHQLRVLSLEMLAELKRLSPHPKDKLILAILEVMLTRRR
jgi:hypothetical protein